MRFLVLSLIALTALPALADNSASVPLDVTVGGRVVTRIAPERTIATYLGGRVVLREIGAQTRYTYAWPGVYFEAQFSGGAVDARLDDDQDRLFLYIDGVHTMTLLRPGRTTLALENLGPGRHTIRLEKTSETQSASASFDGFYVASAEDALPAPQYRRRIEFIGDSYTVGYGNSAHSQTCTGQEIADTTNTSLAYATMTAKHFGAAYRINAYSGDGVVRNYAGVRPDLPLPVLYGYTLFDRSAPAPDKGWMPNVVVIGLGINDFSTPLGVGERWKTRDDLRADFVSSYAAFVKGLRGKWPNAHFILMAATDGDSEQIDAVNAVADRLKNDGMAGLEVLPFGNLDHQACDFHPSLKDDDTIAQLLIDRISRLPKFGAAAVQ